MPSGPRPATRSAGAFPDDGVPSAGAPPVPVGAIAPGVVVCSGGRVEALAPGVPVVPLVLLAPARIQLTVAAVLAMIVVKALAESPWGMFTVIATMPIAIFMGIYMRYIRPGKIGEVSILGFVLLMLAIVAGGSVAASPVWGPAFTFTGPQLCWMLIGYGFIASILPVWLLLAPRDYLSTFMKIGTIVLLAVATSIDALAVGVSFAFLDVNVGVAVAAIGLVTFALSFVAVFVGYRIGTRFRRPAEILGGLVLIGIGTQILIEHLTAG